MGPGVLRDYLDSTPSWMLGRAPKLSCVRGVRTFKAGVPRFGRARSLVIKRGELLDLQTDLHVGPLGRHLAAGGSGAQGGGPLFCFDSGNSEMSLTGLPRRIVIMHLLIRHPPFREAKPPPLHRGRSNWPVTV